MSNKYEKVSECPVQIQEVLDALNLLRSGKESSIERIRECSKCKHFFWVKRLNKNVKTETCEKCNNLIRQQRFQDKNRSEIKKQRRKNYYLKTGVDYCKNCIKPTKKCSCFKDAATYSSVAGKQLITIGRNSPPPAQRTFE